MIACWGGEARPDALGGLTVGNPASAHAEGRFARRLVMEARARVAALVGARAEDVIFTSGATEASNLAVRGAAEARRVGGRLVASTSIEHAATRKAIERLSVEGWQVRLLAVDATGRVRADALEAPFAHGTAVVSLIAGHNELGTRQPLAELAAAAHAVGALLHLDAVQAIAYEDFADVDWDLLSISAHKLGGPAGIGALIRRDDVGLSPLLVGGTQEAGLRPGTLPVALIAGFGAACEVVLADRARAAGSHQARRDRLANALRAGVPALQPIGAWASRPDQALPHVASFLIAGVAGDEIVHALDAAGVAAASASACLGGTRSPTLDALGVADDMGMLRLSLGWTTDDATIDDAAPRVVAALQALLAMDPFERRRGPFEARAEIAGVTLGPAQWQAAEAVYRFWRAEGILPGARRISRLLPSDVQMDALFPRGLPTLAAWLGLPVPRGGCRAMLW